MLIVRFTLIPDDFSNEFTGSKQYKHTVREQNTAANKIFIQKDM